jgi:hypothetical protein
VIEKDVAPAQGDQLASSQAGVGGSEEDGGVLFGLGRMDKGHHLLGREEGEVTGVPLWSARDLGDRVRGQIPDAPCTLEDAVEHGENLVHRPARTAARQ